VPSIKSSDKPKPSLLLGFEAIGTHWSIELFGVEQVPDNLNEAVTARIAEFDKNHSRFRSDSLVAEMSRAAGNYLLPDDAQPMFDLYEKLNTLSNGQVTPLIGQMLVDAGYDASYSLKPGKLHKPPQWEDVMDYRYPNLTLRKPALLDVGAAGKGYLVDLVAKVIEDHGIKAYCVDAGGDMVCKGEDVRVGLEHPDHNDEVIGIVTLQNQALCGSAGNRRKWAQYHHIMDPAKLASAQGVKAVWVTAATALIADGLATALFFVAPDKLMRHYTFNYAVVADDNSLSYSPGFPADFFKE
jgi:thiamine biosynthesis lipoprotein